MGIEYRGELDVAPRTRVLLHANARRIDLDELGRTVKGIEAKCLGGPGFRVSARSYVLAAGGIENPRLLLASRNVQKHGIGNENDLVGRFFMEHPHLLFFLGALPLATGVWVVPTAFVLAEGVAAAGLLVWTRRAVGRLSRPLPKEQWPGILTESAPISGTFVLRTVALRSDLVLLGFLVSMEEVGWYSGAYRLFLACLAFVSLYYVILFPRLVQCAKTSSKAMNRELFSSLKLVLLGAIPASTLIACFSTELLQTLFAPSFEVASSSLRILLAAFVILFVSGHFQQALWAQGRQRIDLCMVVAATAVHVALKLALIPAFGIAGAAWGTLLGEVSFLAMSWWALFFAKKGTSELVSGSPTPALQETDSGSVHQTL